MTTLLEEIEPMARPLTEIDRQKKAIASLGEDFTFPLFNGRQAVESQRKSGYKNTARAAREIVDNAFEVGARNVWVVFDRPGSGERNKHERKDTVSAIAFIDNGPGMIPEMARYALSWGGGTRFDNPKGIGRFGFGLPNSSINQTRRVQVFTRTDAKQNWTMVSLDITRNIPITGLVAVDPPEQAPLPDFVSDYMKKNKVALGTGTVVVWDKPDRLSVRSGSKLRELMVEDFGVVYRYLLDDFKLVVDGVEVKKLDPLFLMSDAMYYVPKEQGGADCQFDKELTVAYSRDAETGTQHLKLLDSVEALRLAREDSSVESVGTISVRISRLPVGFAAERIVVGYKVEEGKRKPIYQSLPEDNDAHRRLQIRKKRRGLSFVRANREIETLDSLPSSSSDKAVGLGDWPVLQTYAYHWAVEIKFTPDLDEAFGIGNDKQTVNPVEDFWRVLKDADVDDAIRKEESYQREERDRTEQAKAIREVTDPTYVNPAAEAAVAAETITGRNRPLPPPRVAESNENLDRAIDARVKETGENRDEAEEAIRREASKKKYAIEFFEAEGGVFYKPSMGNGLQRVANINKAHQFYTSFYGPLVSRGDAKARQSVDLLLMALAKAELEADDTLKVMYEHQRESEWSPFLKAGLKMLEQLQTPDAQDDGDAATK